MSIKLMLHTKLSSAGFLKGIRGLREKRSDRLSAATFADLPLPHARRDFPKEPKQSTESGNPLHG
jgi:hypothetical protein